MACRERSLLIERALPRAIGASPMRHRQATDPPMAHHDLPCTRQRHIIESTAAICVVAPHFKARSGQFTTIRPGRGELK